MKNYFYLVDECDECGHKTYHPIRWLKSLFKKKEPQRYGLPPLTPAHIAAYYLKILVDNCAFTKVMKGIPKATGSTVKIKKPVKFTVKDDNE